MTDQRLGLIGGGNMARSLVGGLINSGIAPESMIVSDPDDSIRQALAEDFSVQTCADNSSAAQVADILVLAVKPQVMQYAVEDIAENLLQRQPLVVSIAAGIPIASIESWAGSPLPLIRVMPNTPAVIGNGASGMYANHRVSESQRTQAQKIMEAIGIAVWVDKESLIDTVTAVSGSGPAYFFYLMDAMVKAAQEGGLNPETSRQLTLQTALGAAQLALASNESPTELRRRVTSPGGTTQAAVEILDKNGCEEILIRAVHAARERSIELAKLLGEQ
jgi:pyrroline-5-carboxylate reductase